MRGAALAHDSFPSVPHTLELLDFLAFVQFGGKGLKSFNSRNSAGLMRREFLAPPYIKDSFVGWACGRKLLKGPNLLQSRNPHNSISHLFNHIQTEIRFTVRPVSQTEIVRRRRSALTKGENWLRIAKHH